MPQLQWDEHTFIECLEVLPVIEEYATEHRFTAHRNDGLELRVIVWQYESVVQLELRRTESEMALLAFALVVRGRANYLKGPSGDECLEFTDAAILPSRFSYLEYQRKKVDVYDVTQMPGLESVRVFVKPEIRIEFPRNPLPL